ncbi:hypothetical protein ACFWXZ_34810 [[Kitasatospora] papulosa]|uniref:hypothetical protein n=1 Tax=Streptomyces TaxID=1883 RepID=UPI0033B11C77
MTDSSLRRSSGNSFGGTAGRDGSSSAAAQQFLVKVMRSSEGIDPDDDLFQPEYVSVEYDDEAFYEAVRESRYSLDEDE